MITISGERSEHEPDAGEADEGDGGPVEVCVVLGDVASNVASLGLCKTWRNHFVSAVDVRPSDQVLDLCAGTNAVGIGLLRRKPLARVQALDRSKVIQEVGRQIVRAIEMFYSSREITELLEHVGFSQVASRDAAGGIMAVHRACKAGL